MKHMALAVAVLTLWACSSPERRIKNNQGAFDAYPPEIQQTIRDGRVDVGFTPEQTLMAWGQPDRKYSRKTAGGAQEVWAYTQGGSSRPGIGVGVGVVGGGPTVYGGGISIGTGDDHYHHEERARVVFEGGKVVSVENRER